MKKFAKIALGALMVAGATTVTTAAITTPAQARVVVGIGLGFPGYYGYGPAYYDPYYAYPSYYGGYYAPRYYRGYYGAWRGHDRDGWYGDRDRHRGWGHHWR